MSLAVGSRLGPYEVQSALGAGGMGEVYRARDTRLNRDVALAVQCPARMPSLADVFRVLNEIRAAGVVDEYAIGGATAVLFYAEPTRTYDLDVFVTLPVTDAGLTPLSSLYEWTEARGFSTVGEHILVYGVPVQFLPAYNALVGEAITEARQLAYEDVRIRVVDPEHLVALALQAGGSRRRERAWQLLEAGEVDRQRLRTVLTRHGVSAEIPDDV